MRQETKFYTSVLLKPTSSRCNLNCSYCFYLSKQELYPWSDSPSLSLKTFENFLRQYIPLSTPNLTFQWQGGEPTMMGLPFFEAAVSLQSQIVEETVEGSPPPVFNAIQTNGTLLTDEWARFFKKWKFLVGISIDGPPEWHNTYRVDLLERGTHHRVMKGISYLRNHDVPFNVLTVVNRSNVEQAEELLRWLVNQGFTDLQFIPCAEKQDGCQSNVNGSVSAQSITPDEYGQFLNTLFDAWIKIGYEKVRIRWFDNLIQMLWGFPGELCQLASKCGYIVLEHNGDCYPCDFEVNEKWFLGNINDKSLSEMLNGDRFTYFASIKGQLHAQCFECPWKDVCFGECPSYRKINNVEAEHTLPYFCPSFQQFFDTKYKKLESIAINAGKSMGFAIPGGSLTVQQRIQSKPQPLQEFLKTAKKNNVGRNQLCPCGSGVKFKKCCGGFISVRARYGST